MTLVFAVLLVVATVAVVALAVRAVRTAQQLKATAVQGQAAEENLAVARAALATAEARVAELSRYSTILDAEAHARTVRASAEAGAALVLDNAKATADGLARDAAQRAASLESEAVRLKDTAAADVARTKAEATGIAQSATTRAAAVVTTAETEARQLIEKAKIEAKAIAGEAYTLKEQVDDLEKTAKALRNVVDGYGDAYIVPTFTLLDDLAEEFGYEEAGQQLKLARAVVRTMTQEKSGAECDYVEQNRRDTAVAFVLDAFNGKTDSILASVKSDNVGTLTQRVKDAFQLINHNGRAFRNARITTLFLDARLAELKWACIATELKEQEREEQRLLREKIREEERAQREFERAMKEAAKEEDTLTKALDKTKAELLKAADADKAKYEAKLFELEGKLREAEAKSKKALSMAQLTKAGHVYIISNIGSFGEDVFKIGLTRRLEPLDRVRELGDASVPFEFDVHAMIKCDDAPALEHQLHKKFVKRQMNKTNPRKEFFRVTLAELRGVVEAAGCPAHWTMTAECKSFKETQAIERALASHSFDEAAWLKQQLAADATFEDDVEDEAAPRPRARAKVAVADVA